MAGRHPHQVVRYHGRIGFTRHQRELLIVMPQFVLIGEAGDRVIGFALAVPDIHQALKYATGRLLPFGLLKILYYKRSIRNLRLMAVGISEEFRTAGVGAAFYAELIRQTRLLNYADCEYS